MISPASRLRCRGFHMLYAMPSCIQAACFLLRRSCREAGFELVVLDAYSDSPCSDSLLQSDSSDPSPSLRNRSSSPKPCRFADRCPAGAAVEVAAKEPLSAQSEPGPWL
mmetsp:Transcript_140316/g.356026  ORF Transcript_140316/g.356026 Transcript_140316/m.356026 type:complete len:109 (+) Transcript_140316:204-530(+)